MVVIRACAYRRQEQDVEGAGQEAGEDLFQWPVEKTLKLAWESQDFLWDESEPVADTNE